MNRARETNNLRLHARQPNASAEERDCDVTSASLPATASRVADVRPGERARPATSVYRLFKVLLFTSEEQTVNLQEMKPFTAFNKHSPGDEAQSRRGDCSVSTLRGRSGTNVADENGMT